ncbi:MAG TPA: UbiA family prenyltransferase [Methanoregula sp.]|nr:UbiA family prenyltransferase [Methanoregula sp.]
MMLINKPTIQLLNSSTAVAIGGGLRLHIAFLLAGLAVRIPEYCACALIIYATYTLDRALDCKEDAINKSELRGANVKIGIFACIITFLMGAYLFILDGIYIAPFFPFVVGYIYTRGIRFGRYAFKLKGGAGLKNIIIGITWGGSVALVVSRWCDSLVTITVIFLFFVLKLFATSCVNDIKDVRGDIAAGIRTLPAMLGEEVTKKILIIILLILYCMTVCAMYLGEIQNEWIILTFSLVLSTGFLAIYSPSFEKSPTLILRKMREIVLSWEYALALALRACVMG